MTEHRQRRLLKFVIELLVYTLLVVVYVAVVLHLLNHWLKDLYDGHKVVYAGTALLLIIIQGVVLEMATSALIRLLRFRSERD